MGGECCLRSLKRRHGPQLRRQTVVVSTKSMASLTFANRGRSPRTQVHGLEVPAEVGEAFPFPLSTHFVDGEQTEQAVALGLGLVEPLVACRLVGEVRVGRAVARDVGRLAPEE